MNKMASNYGYELDMDSLEDLGYEDPDDVYMGEFDKDVDETTFIDDDNAQEIKPYETPKASVSNITRLRRKNLEGIVEKFLKDAGYEIEGNPRLNIDRFRLDKSKKGVQVLQFDKGDGNWVNLTNVTNGTPLTSRTLEKIFNQNIKRQIAIKKLDEIVPTPKEVVTMQPEELKKRVKDLQKQVNTLSEYKNFQPLRELRGLDDALQRLDGEFLNSTSKLTKLKDDIATEENKLKDPALTAEEKAVIERRLKSLQGEYDTRLEALALQKKELQTQFSCIRQTLNKISDGNRTLKERLGILFREQGITIISVLTAVGLTISTLVLALIPGGAAGGSGGGNSPHRIRDWVKRSLKSLARVFGRVAKWALAALPGAIGSIISWLFQLLKTVALTAGEHAYAVVGFLAALTSYYLFKK